jgi:hypothetical protein
MNLKSLIEHFIRSEVIENFLSHISVKSVVGVVCGFVCVLVDCYRLI